MSPDKNALEALRIDRGSARDRRQPRWLLALAVVLILVAAGWIWMARGRAVDVRTALVREALGGGASTVLNASGYVTARRQATVSSKATGKVIEVLFEEGQRVEAGQVLARLDATNIKANLDLAEAQSRAAQSALAEIRVRQTEAGNELRRLRDLVLNHVSSQSDLDHAQAEVDSLQARLERQQAEVSVAERQMSVWQQELEDRIIRAPFTGIVVTKNAQPGEMISPVSAGGGFTRTGIGTIVDMASLEVEVDVNESYINRVESGQEVESTLDAYPGWKIPSKVIAIIPTADRQKATVKVRIGFNQLDPRLLPEMGVKVAFHGQKGAETSASLVIPKTAVRRQNGQETVLVVKQGKVEPRAIKTGAAQGNDVLVSGGLTAGEKVVVNAPDRLAAGQRINEVRP